ncbi:hypothetical protein [Paraburkholderia sp. ZP32-5]|uniref:hypothetical protein n=1 Tax=Paraburkholderia sp. ZP32-5 TaxID=2883245 RepID=UPI001F296149|nr:hypothetical protein [Paraburkholderia sp. ZP32-5]
MDAMQRTRMDAAAAANAEDAAVWRWFAALLEERRVRWRYAFDSWTINVDRVHVATGHNFDDAIRAAKEAATRRGLGLPMLYDEMPRRPPTFRSNYAARR